MKRFKLLLSLVVITVLFVTSSLWAEVDLELSETGFNFGKTVQHAKVSHTFWIKATGDDTLIITKIDPGCGCTQAPIEDTVLAPGDSTAMEIILETRSYRGFVSKKPFFTTNINEEKVYLRIDADLVPNPDDIAPVLFDPPRLDVSQFTEKVRRKAKFKLINKYDRDFEITMLDVANKKFDVELPSVIKAGETVEGLIIVHDDAIDLEFDQSFTIVINDDFRSRFTLPIRRTLRILKRN